MTDLVPSDRLNSARIKFPNPQSDLASPGFLGVFIHLGVKTFDERIG
jgi:hypothetical protein